MRGRWLHSFLRLGRLGSWLGCRFLEGWLERKFSHLLVVSDFLCAATTIAVACRVETKQSVDNFFCFLGRTLGTLFVGRERPLTVLQILLLIFLFFAFNKEHVIVKSIVNWVHQSLPRLLLLFGLRRHRCSTPFYNLLGIGRNQRFFL